MIKKILICFLVELILSKVTVASDTLYITKALPLETIGIEYAPKYLLIERKTFKVPFANNNGFFNALSYSKDDFTQVYFRNSNFEVFESGSLKLLEATNSGFYIIDSCIVNQLPIFNTTGNVVIASTQLKTLDVRNTNNLQLSLSNDSLISFIVIQENKNIELQVIQCALKDSGQINIINSTIKKFDFLFDKRSGCNIFFQNDTIQNFASLIGSEPDEELQKIKKTYKHENTFTFYKCHINTDFIFFDNIPNSTFIFNNCTFGPNAYLGDMAADKIILKNCKSISEQLVLGFREKDKEVHLGIMNSNLDNIRFEFLSNIRLAFDSTDSRDAMDNSYKNLLEKFEHEGKKSSFKAVDLQYRKFSDSKFFHLLSYVWWYHGYKPELVFLWTLILLICFFSFNIIYWKQIFEIYPLKENQRPSTYDKVNRRWQFYSIVLLYTLFIFFSLRVDLNKLNFKTPKFVYAFLVQYLLGLWCIIFIIRFIMKL